MITRQDYRKVVFNLVFIEHSRSGTLICTESVPAAPPPLLTWWWENKDSRRRVVILARAAAPMWVAEAGTRLLAR